MLSPDHNRGATEIARTPAFSYFLDPDEPDWLGWSESRGNQPPQTALLRFSAFETRIVRCERLRDLICVGQRVRVYEDIEIDVIYFATEQPEMPLLNLWQIINLPISVIQSLISGREPPSWLRDARPGCSEPGLPGLLRAVVRQPVNLVSVGSSGQAATLWWDPSGDM